VMAALQRRGLTVAPFKVGPDFIDPGHHTCITGRASRNLDGWMLDREYNRACFRRRSADADVAVVEGVMGLYDGFSGSSEAGSTAQMAKWLDLPVVLVVNAASMARSAAALVRGFTGFDTDLAFAGVVFNHLGSPGHLDYLQAAMQAYVEIPLLGGLVRDERLRMPERHLGLITTDDQPLSQTFVDLLVERIEAQVDLDGLLQALPEVHSGVGEPHTPEPVAAPDGVRIGVARDRAFCFYYPDNLAMLTAAGAQIVPFSPMTDDALPDALDGIYLGGGYPELYAEELTGNVRMRAAILQSSRAGMPIYAECGGFMYLCRELKDGEGIRRPMCGCFPFGAQMHPKMRTLGYREVRLTTDTLLGQRGDTVRGHEFHYSDLEDPSAAAACDTTYQVTGRKAGAVRLEGYRINNTLGSYVHLHFGSRPSAAAAFVDHCRCFRRRRNHTGEA